MKNYSQNREQEIILDFFKDQPPGVFASIGENDGETFSNVRALALMNWRGIMVEPSPRAFERLKKLYDGHKGFYIYNFAISDHNGKAILHESGAQASPSDVGLVSTFHMEEKARFDRVVKYDPVEVKTFRWRTFMNRLRFKEFDFISMDIEGSEMSVLPEMDLTNTKLICIEHNGKADLKRQYLECTSKYGLNRVIYESGENVIIAR